MTQARSQLYYHLANIFLRLHCYGAAANAFGRALRDRPGDPHLEFQRAWSLLQVPARRVDGIAAFDVLMKSSPSALGYYVMACGLQKESRHEEAVQAFREAARLAPSESADLHHNHAVSLSTLRRFEEAADAYQRAAHLNPSDGDAWGNLGAVLVELGRWKDAAPCQERAMRLAPSLLHGLNLGETLYELNRLDEAERVLRECLVIDPRSTDAKEALAMVLAGMDRVRRRPRVGAGALCGDPRRAVGAGCVIRRADGSRPVGGGAPGSDSRNRDRPCRSKAAGCSRFHPFGDEERWTGARGVRTTSE